MSNKITLSEQIYDELYHDITDQRLVCGQKLTLKVLKDRFNVSHTPIREALTRLSENGLVTYYSNCGVTVTEFTRYPRNLPVYRRIRCSCNTVLQKFLYAGPFAHRTG